MVRRSLAIRCSPRKKKQNGLLFRSGRTGRAFQRNTPSLRESGEARRAPPLNPTGGAGPTCRPLSLLFFSLLSPSFSRQLPHGHAQGAHGSRTGWPPPATGRPGVDADDDGGFAEGYRARGWDQGAGEPRGCRHGTTTATAMVASGEARRWRWGGSGARARAGRRPRHLVASTEGGFEHGEHGCALMDACPRGRSRRTKTVPRPQGSILQTDLSGR